jgi:hypothetical protein
VNIYGQDAHATRDIENRNATRDTGQPIQALGFAVIMPRHSASRRKDLVAKSCPASLRPLGLEKPVEDSMMRKENVAGTVGTAMTGLVWVIAILMEVVSPLIAVVMLGACLSGFVLGLLAAIRGRRWWLLQCLFALLTAAFVLLGLVGS